MDICLVQYQPFLIRKIQASERRISVYKGSIHLIKCALTRAHHGDDTTNVTRRVAALQLHGTQQLRQTRFADERWRIGYAGRAKYASRLLTVASAAVTSTSIRLPIYLLLHLEVRILTQASPYPPHWVTSFQER
jgi:hypothetical protein